MNGMKRCMSILLIATVLTSLVLMTGAAADGKVELRFMWWGGNARHEATLAAIDRYMELNPNVKIIGEYTGYDGYYQKLATQMAGNAAPDLIQMDTMWFYDLMRQGDMFVDLSTLGEITTGVFDQEMLDACLRNGKLVGLPTGVIVEQWMITNKDLFERHNIPTDTALDWNTLLEYGKKVHEESPDEYLLLVNESTLVPLLKLYIMQRTGESIVTDDYELKIDESIMTDAFAYLKQLYDEGVIVPFDEAVSTTVLYESTYWLNGKAGMLYGASSIVPSILTTVDFTVSQIGGPLMADAKDTGVEIRPAQIMSINSASAHVAETAKFLNWLLTDSESIEILKNVRGVPANQTARQLLQDKGIFDPLVVEINNAALKVAGNEPSDLSFNAELTKIFEDCIAKIAYGIDTPENVAHELITQFEAKLIELK